MNYLTLDVAFDKDCSEYFGEDAVLYVGYEFTPGRPATYLDPPEPAEVSILDIEREDGMNFNVYDLPLNVYNTLVDMIINIEEEFSVF